MTSDEIPPVTGATKVLAILGRPIEHALSPLIHNAALRSAKSDTIFIPFSPTEADLEMCLRGLVAGGCAGLCITIPYKTAVVPLVDHLDASAVATGAVNTVAVDQDLQLTGYNTDVDGVLLCYRSLPAKPRKRGLLLGAGGAARAAVAAIARTDIEHLTIVNRTISKAETVKDDFADADLTIDTAEFQDQEIRQLCADADLLVNTTSVGMYPKGDAMPVPPEVMHPGLDVIDAIYRPQPTRLCQEAINAGASALAGVDWIIGQGVAAMKYWTGLDADEAAMRKAITEFLGRQ